MAASSSSKASIALFLTLNLLLFSYSPANAACNIDSFSVCTGVMKNLMQQGAPEQDPTPCCNLIRSLPDADAKTCLCKAAQDRSVFRGIVNELNISVAVQKLLDKCNVNNDGHSCTFNKKFEF